MNIHIRKFLCGDSRYTYVYTYTYIQNIYKLNTGQDIFLLRVHLYLT